jgi:hypothetical protein
MPDAVHTCQRTSANTCQLINPRRDALWHSGKADVDNIVRMMHNNTVLLRTGSRSSGSRTPASAVSRPVPVRRGPLQRKSDARGADDAPFTRWLICSLDLSNNLSVGGEGHHAG